MENLFCYFFPTFFFLKVFCELEINVFENKNAYVIGFLHKTIQLNSKETSLPIKFEKLTYDQLRLLCSKLNFSNIHSMSYPKKLNFEQSYTRINCSLESCQ